MRAALRISNTRSQARVCLSASASACEWFGCPQNRLVGRSLAEISPELATAVAPHLATLGAVPCDELPIIELPEPVELPGRSDSLRLTLIPEDEAILLTWTAHAPTTSEFPRLMMAMSNVEFLARTRHGIVLTDARGVLEWCNRGFSQISGYPLQEIRGRRLGSILQGPDTDQDEAARVRQRVREGASIQTELLNYDKSGRPYWVRIEAEPFTDADGIAHYLGIQVDVTEERQRAEALVASEARLRATLRASEDSIYWLAACRDEQGEIVDFEFLDVNPAVEVELGMTHAQLIGQRINELFPINRSGGFFEHYKAVAETGETYRNEYEIPREHAAPGYYRHLVMKIGDGVVIFNRNLTEDRAREMVQRRSLRMAALGRLASGIAHDFNNVLAGIGFSAEVLLSRVEDSATQKIVTSIAKSTQRAGEFVKQVLMFAGRTERDLVPHRLDEALSESLEMLERSLSTTMKLHSTLASGLTAMVDHGQLDQLITNLVTNASHALNGRGNIWVELSDAPRDELPEALWPLDEVERCGLLTVRDDGVGMDPAVLEQIFDPFYTTKSADEGTGLGLSIVHGIVQDHRGRVIVESKVGVGTLIKVALPLLPASNHEGAREDPAGRSVPLEGVTILLVDDDELIAESLGAALELNGFHAIVCSDPALALAEARQPGAALQVALIDLNMPGTTGLELAFSLRELQPELKILLMTGGGTPLGAQELDRAGIVGVLHKPFSSKHLRAEIARLL